MNSLRDLQAVARTAPIAVPQPPRASAAARTHIDVDVEGALALEAAHAPVTLVAFSDFACPYCSRVAPTLEQLHVEFGDRLRIVFKHFPHPMHPQAMAAHKAVQAAALQKEFWAMHDKIFAAPKDWNPPLFVVMPKTLAWTSPRTTRRWHRLS